MVDEIICVQNTSYADYFENAKKNTVFMLSKKLAENTWNRVVHDGSSSYFDLPDDCWIVTNKTTPIGRWIEAYNNDDNAAVEKSLRAAVDWSDDTLINFFAKNKIVFRTSWLDFLHYWDGFLAAEDDCPMVIPENTPRKEAILFRPIGNIIKIG